MLPTKAELQRNPLKQESFGALRNWAIYILMSLFGFFIWGVSFLCLIFVCLFQKQILLPCQLNPEAVKIAEGASSSARFLILTYNITLQVPTGPNIQYSFSIKQVFSSSAFLK